MTSKRDVLAIVKRAKPRRESATVLLDVGDGAQDEYDELVELIATVQAQKPGTTRAAKAEHAARVDELKRQLSALNARIVAESQIEFTFEALPALKWAEVLDDHPPRDGNQLDLYAGMNRATGWPGVVRACMVEPDLTDDEWDSVAEVIGAGDMDRLGRQVVALNDRTPSLPKLPSDFLSTGPPSSDSKPPAPGV